MNDCYICKHINKMIINKNKLNIYCILRIQINCTNKIYYYTL